jgi:hypothetical protein
MKRIEALALAIAAENDCLNPGSEAFVCLNPGMLRSYSLEKLNVVNESGTRVFRKFEDGWRALLANLQVKCSGATRAKGHSGKLSPDSTLKDLVKSFHFIQTRKIVEHLNDSLEDRAINESTPLRFFLEE